MLRARGRIAVLLISFSGAGLAGAAVPATSLAACDQEVDLPLVTAKERAHDWVRAIERIWDFYFELFGQRQSMFADWLLSCDRIALSCYQAAYLGVGEPNESGCAAFGHSLQSAPRSSR